jgi:2-desacetyl-2-hydroxyethyl bacteriochlorophyllide A dehydrogenase
MKAIVKQAAAPGIEIVDMAIPEVGDADILLKVLAGSLCGSDVHIYEWTAGYEWVPMPVVLGHEYVGEVVKIGSKVKGLAVGERITTLPMMPCGECDYCQMGKVDSCRKLFVLGLTRNGAFAEYMLVKSGAEVLKIPDTLASEIASLCEPLSIGLKAIDLSGIKPGQTAAVLGPGPIGLLMVALLKAAGAGYIAITGTGVDKLRLDIARQLGADDVIDVEQADPVAQIEKAAGKLDFVFEATGIPQTIPQGLAMLKKGGKMLVAGIHAQKASIDPIDLVRQSKSLIGVYGYDREIWTRALRLMSTGKINLAPIITHRLPFSKGQEGFDLAVSRKAAKVVFIPET